LQHTARYVIKPLMRELAADTNFTVYNININISLLTRSSDVAERPRDASSHWIFC